MFTKTAKKFWVFISSAVASVCLAVGAIAMPSANVAQAAIDGRLSEEVTLNKVVADADGKTAEGFVVQYKEFEMGESGNTWFMTEFTGKNAPNYAVRAVKGYSSWDGEYTGSVAGYGTITKQGIMITNSNMFSQVGIGVFRGTMYMDESNGERGCMLANNDKGAGLLGMRYYNANTRYIQIIGYELGSGNAALMSTYLFSVDAEGAVALLAKVEQQSMDAATHVLGGTKAVIYGNVQVLAHAGADETTLSAANNPDSVTFQYATPANSLVNLLKGVTDHYEYKDDIVTALNVTEDVSHKVEAPKTEKTALTSSATLNKIQATNGVTKEGTTNKFVSFDMGTNGSNAWVITQFTGKNAPNYAINAAKPGLAEWKNETGNNATAENNIAGTLVTNSSEYNAEFLQSFASSNTASGKAKANNPSSQGVQSGSQKPGLACLTDGVEYIQIVGFEAVPNSNTRQSYITYYMFKVEGGRATLTGAYTPKADGTVNGGQWTLNPYGRHFVFYGNIHCSALANNPDGVTFSYEAPQTTLEGLVKSLDNSYAYKDDIATAVGVTLDPVQKETYTATYEDMDGNTLKTLTEVEAVKLPGSTLADFAGWYNKADGKLYKSGETIALTANTTFVEVATGVDLADGAAVRLVKDAAGVGGLRFEASFSKAAYDLLGANMKVEGGVIPTDLLNGEFALDNEDARYVELTKTVLKGGEYHAYITLMNIKLENFQRAFSARVFVTVTYADGTKATVASEYNAEYHSRSIYQVAVKAYNSGNYGENEVLKYYIDNSASVALTVSEGVAGVTTEHTYDGLAANYTRGYTISGVSYAEGTVSFTVTLKDTTVNGDGVVTMWTAEKVSQEVVVTFVNGVATVNFPVAL